CHLLLLLHCHLKVAPPPLLQLQLQHLPPKANYHCPLQQTSQEKKKKGDEEDDDDEEEVVKKTEEIKDVATHCGCETTRTVKIVIGNSSVAGKNTFWP
ncbi:hypothetical protein ABVT39_026303, partial [Epinephelus coioides]